MTPRDELDDFTRACIEAVRADTAARQRPIDSFCKCNRVLERLAKLTGDDTPQLLACLHDETAEWSDAELRWYDRFVEIVRRGVHVEGQGNFGDPDEGVAPAHPKFLECRLTERGVRQLQAR